MRLLSVSPTIPWPPDDGTRNRIWHLLRHVARHEEVVALTWQAPEDRHDAASMLGEAVAQAVVLPTVPVDRGAGARLRRQAVATAGGLPPFVQALREQRGFDDEGRAPGLEAVEALHREQPFDAVLAEVDAARFLLPCLTAPVVVQRHNVFSDTIADLRRGTPRQVLWAVERKVWERFDRRTVGDLQVATTEESAAALRRRVDGAVAVVPNGADTSVPLADPAAGTDVVFVGRLDYRPNTEAVRWFVRHVWPAVRTAGTGVRLVVIGAGGPEQLADVAGDPEIVVTGYVEDLAAALRTARVGVVPLQAGLGIKTKTLDLLARGVPVVATPAGAEGIPAGGDGGLVVASGAADFAAAVVAMLSDPHTAGRRGTAGRRLVEEQFSWEASAARYRQLVSGVAGARPGGKA